MNWGEILTKANQALYNAGQVVRNMWRLYYDNTPREVQVSLYDEKGQLVTTKVPNRAFIKKQLWDDVGGAVAQWRKVLHVNFETGDDNNFGTVDSPLKTLKAAIDRIPTGGKGTIILHSNYTVEDVRTGENKVIAIIGQLDSNNQPIITLRNSKSEPASRIIVENGTKLILRRLIIEANNNSNTVSHWTTLLKVSQAPGTAIYIGEWFTSKTTKIVLNNSLLNVETAITTLTVRNCQVTASNNQNLVSKWDEGHFLFTVEGSVIDDTVTLPAIGWN